MNQNSALAPLVDTAMDQTIIKPRPGGSRRLPTAPVVAPQLVTPAIPSSLPTESGLNPLVGAATPLLTLLTRLRNTLTHPDAAALRSQLIDEVRSFEARARSEGVNAETVLNARYVLCTALDEVVLNTPWGSSSVWAKQSLLAGFHNETWGGEKFFLLLENLCQSPSANRELLELMYICLALGFEGRYRIIDGGRTQLELLREQLHRTLRAQRGDFERELSPHWQGVTDPRNPLIRYIPLWVVASIAGALLLCLFLGFSFSLNRASDPVFSELHAIRADDSLLLARPEPPLPLPTIDLYTLLAPEIRAGLVYVNETATHRTVVIRGDGLFGSGSSSVKSKYHPLLIRIAEALSSVQGHVLVTGHSDSIPIRTARFPSNWHLSQARASAVLEILQSNNVAPTRLSAEGRADTEPLATNDTRENRARNRRVEITLINRPGGSP